MHLRKVAIRNYRSLVKVDLTLGDITVVIGKSDVGKSNLVRALRDWANYTTATDIATWGKGVVRIAVAVGEQHKVVFEKTFSTVKKEDKIRLKAKARFVLKDAETGSVLSYEKVGRSVPEEIQVVTGLREVTVGEKGDSDQLRLPVHFSTQGDNWFLVGPKWSATQVSKVIAKISGVDALILANKDLVSEQRTNNRQVKEFKERVLKCETSLERFEGVEEAAEMLAEAEEFMDKVTEDERVLGQVMSLLGRIRENRLAKERALETLGAYEALVEFADESNLLGDQEALVEVLELDEEINERSSSVVEETKIALALRALVDHADETNLLEDFDAWANGLDVERMIVARGNAKEVAERAAEAALDRVNDLHAELETLSEDEALLCPLCGKPAHAACRRELKRVARSQE